MSDIIDKRTDDLLNEYIEHRAAIKGMIKDLEEIKESIDKLIPKHLDARMARFFEEKVKAVTGLFGALLDMRKEIAKSVKDEIEIRRKIGGSGDTSDNLEKFLDIRKLADKVSRFKKEKDNLVKSREEDELIPEEIEALKVVTKEEK